MSSVGHRAVQDVFLDYLRRTEASVTVFLVNGVKLQGIVAQSDAHTLLLRRDGHVQLVYKHAVSTIMPAAPMSHFMEEEL
ncbi:RNA chaperone Hfq [Gluconobacter kanchanaburiensis]|uniref:RNA-binding protein Hfq n=1 Tax=Gluconobacter kanchanaburiensis NBRC 103587 TaxID=1307948 RepID=A0A511B9M5_9PROT|nr:RNA-binding protein Hfq [Gluconobacter kanchanaburiensis NBRC 103587]